MVLLQGKEGKKFLVVVLQAQCYQVLDLGFDETFSSMEEAQGVDVGSGEV